MNHTNRQVHCRIITSTRRVRITALFFPSQRRCKLLANTRYQAKKKRYMKMSQTFNSSQSSPNQRHTVSCQQSLAPQPSTMESKEIDLLQIETYEQFSKSKILDFRSSIFASHGKTSSMGMRITFLSLEQKPWPTDGPVKTPRPPHRACPQAATYHTKKYSWTKQTLGAIENL